MDPTQIADEAIGLFLEYRDQHGYDEETARAKAVQEVAEAESFGVLTESDNCPECASLARAGMSPCATHRTAPTAP